MSDVANPVPGAGAERFPPVTAVGMTSLGLIVVGGIYLAAHLPEEVPLAPAVALLVASVLLLGANLVMMSRVPGFAWQRFVDVGKWALLAYAITAGLIGWVFVRDGLRGGTLVVLVASLVVYALQVPLLIGFTVARHHRS
jgi:hypothetical protein